jgi:hypothetical protein
MEIFASTVNGGVEGFSGGDSYMGHLLRILRGDDREQQVRQGRLERTEQAVISQAVAVLGTDSGAFHYVIVVKGICESSLTIIQKCLRQFLGAAAGLLRSGVSHKTVFNVAAKCLIEICRRIARLQLHTGPAHQDDVLKLQVVFCHHALHQIGKSAHGLRIGR